jgi:putative hemolysin
VKIKNFYLLMGILVIIVVFVFLTRVQALPDVAKVYCDKLNSDFGNYVYKVVEEDAGQRGVCVLPNNQEVDAWDFFTGKVARDFSYCAKKGYDSEIDEGGIFAPYEQVCLVRSLTFLPPKKVSVATLANLDYKENPAEFAPPSIAGEQPSAGPSKYNQKDFSYWDWRNPPESTEWGRDNYAFFDQINGWLTNVKDQGSCRACWSFGVMGSVESKYKIISEDSMPSPDLSEQYLVSDCCIDCGNCSGGSRYASFDYLISHGVSDEQCFKYQGKDYGCVPCEDQRSRLWAVDDYVTANYKSVSDLKQRIIDGGPATIIMDWGGGWDKNGIYKCDGSQNEGTHIVVLAGYNDTGNPDTGYWITKNSFGLSWPGKYNIGEGYFKLGFDTCNVGTVIYPKDIIAPDFKPTIVLNTPANGYYSDQQGLDFSFTVYNKSESKKSKCYLVIDGVEKKMASVDNLKLSSIYYLPDSGKHTWRIDCWEDKIGIKNSSETRNFELNFHQNEQGNESTVVYLDDPMNHFSGSGNVTIKCEAQDSRKITNLSLYINISGWTMIITNSVCDQGCFLEYSEFFNAGEYKWNCMAVGSQIAWASENFTFDIVSAGTGGENGSDGGNLSNASIEGNNTGGAYEKSFINSMGSCQKASKRCWSTSVLQQCIDGKWGNLQFCAYGCDLNLLKCRVCKEGERMCSQDGSNLLVCSNDSWKTQICKSGCESGECMSGSQNTNEGISVFFFIFGIPLIIILAIVAIILFIRHRNNRYLESDTKLMGEIKNEI